MRKFLSISFILAITISIDAYAVDFSGRLYDSQYAAPTKPLDYGESIDNGGFGIQQHLKSKPSEVFLKEVNNSPYLKMKPLEDQLHKETDPYLQAKDMYEKIPEDSSPYLKPNN